VFAHRQAAKVEKLHHVRALFFQVVERKGSLPAKRCFWCKNGAETVQFSGIFGKLYRFSI